MTKHDHTHTFGLAIGLGVGIPVFVTIVVILAVTIRHHYHSKREDEEHKDLDFTGDITFYAPEERKPRGVFSNSAESTLDDEAVPVSVLYTPDLATPFGSQDASSKTSLSREIYSVYGPAPAYASVEKLKAPSVSTTSLYSYQSPKTSSSTRIGYFPQSPQRYSAQQDYAHESDMHTNRYASNGSVESNGSGSSAHPYSNLLGNPSAQAYSISTNREATNSESAGPFATPPRTKSQYHNRNYSLNHSQNQNLSQDQTPTHRKSHSYDSEYPDQHSPSRRDRHLRKQSDDFTFD